MLGMIYFKSSDYNITNNYNDKVKDIKIKALSYYKICGNNLLIHLTCLRFVGWCLEQKQCIACHDWLHLHVQCTGGGDNKL